MKNKKITTKHLPIIFILVFLTVFFWRIPTSSAIPVIVVANPWQTVWEQIQAALLSAIKQTSAVTLDKTLSNAIGGKTPMYVTNWENFLQKEPEKRAKKFANDYLTKATQGKGSFSNYIPKNVADKLPPDVIKNLKIGINDQFEGVGPNSFKRGLAQNDPEMARFLEITEASTDLDELEEGDSNYANTLIEAAKENIINKENPVVTYQDEPDEMFADGNFKNLSKYISGINNPWAFQASTEAAFQENLEAEKEEAKTEAVAYQGFIGKEKDGVITTPGSISKDMVSDVKNIGNKILADARSIPEVLISTVTNFASKAISDGISNIQTNLQNEVDKNINTATKKINQAASPLNSAANKVNKALN